MKLTAEDYKQHYRTLSDDELLAIEADDLVDIARRCYDAELTRRQLAPEPEGPPDAEAEPSSHLSALEIDPAEELVRVTLLIDFGRALQVQKVLQEADIPSVLNRDPKLPGTYADGTFGVSVPTSCADAARDFIVNYVAWDYQLLVRRWFEYDWKPEGMELSESRVTVDDLFGDGDKVAVRFTVEAINTRTGRDVKFGGLAIVRVAAGEIAETWTKLDS
jgi:hypothetical protein